MKAAVFEHFQGPLTIRDVSDPKPQPDAAVIRVAACGICRSDWHGWMGHDSDVQPPHVPGHELAGTVVATGAEVSDWTSGDRVTVPFCCGCGTCVECCRGNTHICDNYTQPGFTHWGAFAEYVEIRHADVNLVRVPETIEFATAASLGCRFATSFRGLIDQAALKPNEWVAIYGCGGVGLSAVMIAVAAEAKVVAIDPDEARLQVALDLGAVKTVNPRTTDPVEAIVDEIGAVDVSVDALGSHSTCFSSIRSLRKQGRHIQIGLTLGAESDPPLPMGDVVGKELQILGSHGMQAAEYPRMLRMIERGELRPDRLIRDRVTLAEGAQRLSRFGQFPGAGVTVIEFD